MRADGFHLALALSVGMTVLGTSHAGERTYRWTDAQGRVHYSDVRNEKSESVQIKPGSGISSEPKDSPAAVAARQMECQRRKDQVALYNSSTDISETDALGVTRSYTAEERARLIEKAQQLQQAACSLPGAAASDEGER